MAIIKQPSLATKSLSQQSLIAPALNQSIGVSVVNAEVTPVLLYITGSVIQPTVTVANPTINSSTVFYLPLNCVTNGASTVNGALEVLDKSSNGYVIIQNGDAQLSVADQKFGSSSLYMTNGSLTIPFSSNFNVGSAFTYEGWFKFSGTGTANNMFFFNNYQDATYQVYFRYKTAPAMGVFNVFIKTSDGNYADWNTSALGDFRGDNLWHHVAISGNSNSLYFYLDGTSYTFTKGGTGTTAYTLTTGTLYIGTDVGGSEDWKGYSDNIRISNSIRYPSGTTFTPSITSFEDDANTMLLLDCDTQDLSSLGGNTPLIPNFIGTAQLSTAQKAYAEIDGTSLLLDDNSDYVALPITVTFDNIFADLNNNYFFDCWVKRSGTGARDVIFAVSESGSDEYAFEIDANDKLYFLLESGASTIIEMTSSVTIGTDWTHVALSINGNGSTFTCGMYINGQQDGYDTTNTAVDLTDAVPIIGAQYMDATAWFGGYLAHCRLQAESLASPNVSNTDTIDVPTEPYSATV